MLIDAVRACLVRDLEGLSAELDGYADDASVWTGLPGFANSTGTLVVHCCGNLRHFVGAVLGQSGYVRTRDVEFSVRDLPRAELHLLLAVTRDEVVRALDGLDAAVLEERFPAELPGGGIPTDRMLVHLASHLAYHLGQVDSHRRTVTGDRRSVGALGLAALLTPS
ncbi:MAG: DinB family protein [Gemmatimonadota bacterium]